MKRTQSFIPFFFCFFATATWAQTVAPPAPTSAPASRPVATSLPATASAADREIAAAIRQRVEQEIEKQKIVGLSLAVAQAGEIRCVLHFGWEDREREIPASDQTMYRWASISKPLTAIVTMQLADESKLDLDRDVRQYVPEFPEKPFPITARQLLCHQGGIVHYANGKVVRSPPPEKEHPYEDVVDALNMFKESPLICEPGEKFSYTTHGYILLGAVAQRAGGQSFAKLVNERIARPAGMATLQPDYQWVEIPHRTIGYRNLLGRVVPSTNSDVSWKLAGGGFISNILDMSRFSIGLLEGHLIGDATRERMWTPQKTRDGKATTYGLGFGVVRRNGELEVSHSGGQEKTSTFLLLRPAQRLSVAIMCNTEGADLDKLAREVAALAVKK